MRKSEMMVEQDRPGKIFVGGLAIDVEEKTLENAFAKYGRLTEILVIRDKISLQSRGYGFVTYENPLDAEDAVKGMEGQELNGKTVHVEQAVRAVSGDRNQMRHTRGMRSRRGGPPMNGRGSSRGGYISKPLRSRMASDRRGSPPPRRGSSLRGSGRGRGGLSYSRRQSSIRPRYDSGGRSSMMSRRDMSPPRKGPLLPSRGPPSSPRHSSFSGRGPSFHDSQPRRMSSDRREDRFGNSFSDRSYSDRGRDYAPSPPPRESSRGILDSRMHPSRSSRDYPLSSRDYPPSREYSSRDYSPDREPIRSRGLSPRDYSRDDRRESFGRTSSRDYMSQRGGDYVSSRDSGRDYGSSRDYVSSRDYSSSREPVSRDYSSRDFSSGSRYSSRSEMDSRGPPSRDYDMHRSSFDDNGPPSRSYSSSGPGSRGPPPQSRGPPSFGSSRGSRGPPGGDRRSDRGGFGPGSRRPGPPPRGPPPAKRSRVDAPPRSGPPPFRR